MTFKQELLDLITNKIFDNNQGRITAADIKKIFTEIADKYVPSDEVEVVLTNHTGQIDELVSDYVATIEDLKTQASNSAIISKSEFDDRGPYNANLNIPNLSGSYNQIGLLKQPLYTVTVSGSAKFVGNNFASGSMLYIGDELRGLSGSWYRKPFSDLALNKVLTLEPIVSSSSVKYTDVIIPASTNILNMSASIVDRYVHTAGQLLVPGGVSGSFYTTEFITWGSASTISTGLFGARRSIFSIAQYNSSQVFISGSYQGTDINTPISKVSGSVYFRLTYRNNVVNQINYGTDILPHELYYPEKTVRKGTADLTNTSVVFTPDINDEELNNSFAKITQGVTYNDITVYSTNLYDFNTASQVNGFLSTSTGNIGVSTPGTYHPSPFIPWNENSDVIVGYSGSVATIGAYSALQYDSAFNPMPSSWTGTNANLFSLTRYPNAVYFRITLREGQQNQLNYGTVALPYEAFYEPIIRIVASTDTKGDDVSFKPDISDADLISSFTEKAYLNTSIKQNDGNWASYKIIKVKKDGTGDFTNIMQAIASITDASPSNKYLVQIYDNHYAYVKSDYSPVPSASGYFALAHIKANVKLIGVGEQKTIYGELPIDLLLADYTNYETCHWDGDGEVENIKFVAKNTRYPVHYEQANGTINQNTKINGLNVTIEHLGCLDVPSAQRWSAPDAWGGGATAGVRYELNGMYLIGTRYALRIHTNTLSTFPNRYILTNNRFISKQADGVAINLDNLGFQEKVFVELEGNHIEGSFTVPSTVGTATLIDKILPSIKIVGHGNNPFYFNNAQNIGTTLKITSLTTGLSSSVKLITDDGNLFGDTISDIGSLGISGSLYGSNELTAFGTDRRNVIGHRLGNCTVINKLLVLNIDGTNRTVTFNQNYSNGTYTGNPLIDQTTILNEINTELAGYAIASYYQPNLEYYPELSDVLYIKGNSSTTTFIPKGTFIKNVGMNQCRIATTDEIPDGMAIDDIPVSSSIMKMGRIIKNCIVQKTGRFAPLFEIGSDTFAEGTIFKISINGKLVIDTVAKTGFAKAIDSNKILIV